MANKLFTNVMVFDGTSKRSFPGEVLVQGNQIKTVAKGKTRVPREGASVIDGGGATLMPGLVNCHGHLAYTDFASPDDAGNTPAEENMLIATYNARTALDHGFTAVVSGSTQRGAFPARATALARSSSTPRAARGIRGRCTCTTNRSSPSPMGRSRCGARCAS